MKVWVDLEALESAYDIVYKVNDHLENVIATSDEYPASDIEDRDRCVKFIEEYQRVIVNLQGLYNKKNVRYGLDKNIG